MSFVKSRRSFLQTLAAAAGVTGTAAPVSAPLQQPLTPAQYLKEIQAIGWRAVAAVWRGQPLHVLEYGPRLITHENLLAFWRIQNRVPTDGDFWRLTARYLFDRGLHENLDRGRSS